MTLGFMSGPVLGGVAYQVGGFYAVFGVAFGIVALDFFLRLAVVEKRIAERWLCLEEGEQPTQENGYVSEQPEYGAIGGVATVAPGSHAALETSKGTFAIGKLLRQPRILISLWAVIVGALVVSAFDAARKTNSFDCIAFPLTFCLDASHFREKHLRLGCAGGGIDIPPGSFSCDFPTLLR
jgi:MFS family permease